MICRKNVLDLDTRSKIYDYILKHPGLHQREISRKLKIPKTTLIYHLRLLKKRELITYKKIESHNRYYTVQENGSYDKKIIGILRQEIPCNIFMFIFVNVIASRQDLSKAIEQHPNTISFHLNKFIKMGLVERCQTDKGIVRRANETKVVERSIVTNEIVYRLKDTPTIYDFFIRNRNVFNDNIMIKSVFQFLDDECSIYWPLPKIIKDRHGNIHLENIEKIINEMFPLPFRA